MESMEHSVPPGFRFHPTDEELVGYYLKKKVASQKIDLDVIRDIDLYRIEPWDLQDRCRIGYEEQNEWYFFSHKDKKYPTGTRTNRATMAGFWKATGRDKAVYDKSRLIGMRKTLVFYRGRAPNGQKTDWIMHEYRLESDENAPPQEEGWVVCRAFKKRATSTSQTRTNEGWDSSYFYDEPSGTMSSIVDPPINYIHRQHDQHNYHHHQQQQQQQHRFLCKQEFEAAQVENFNFLHSTDHQFVQLPQLESPSLPLLKRPNSLLSVVLDNNSNNNDEDEEQIIGRRNNNNNNTEKVTDWRALDKFVASQLSQEERFDGNLRDHNHHNNNSNESDENNADMALLLLQGNGEDEGDEGEKLKGFLASTSDCDIGICIFDKV